MNQANDLRSDLRKYILEYGKPLHQLGIFFGGAIHEKNFLAAWALADSLTALKELMLEQMGDAPVNPSNYQGVPEALPAEAAGTLIQISESIGKLLGERDLLGLKFFQVAIDQLRELFLKKLQEHSPSC